MTQPEPGAASADTTLTANRRFDAIASNFATSEVHRTSSTLDRLQELVRDLGPAVRVCDVASGAGHTGFSFAAQARTIAMVDPAPSMLAECRKLAETRAQGATVEYVEAFAEDLPLADDEYDVVVSRLAPHHFTDVARAIGEMGRVARPGGLVAVIDLQGDSDPAADALNHAIEMLHDPTHIRSYSVEEWHELLAGAGLEVLAIEGGHRESAAGVPVKRWCEIAASGAEAQDAIRSLLAGAPPRLLASLGIARDGDEFLIPVRTVLAVARKDDR